MARFYAYTDPRPFPLNANTLFDGGTCQYRLFDNFYIALAPWLLKRRAAGEFVPGEIEVTQEENTSDGGATKCEFLTGINTELQGAGAPFLSLYQLQSVFLPNNSPSATIGGGGGVTYVDAFPDIPSHRFNFVGIGARNIPAGASAQFAPPLQLLFKYLIAGNSATVKAGLFESRFVDINNAGAPQRPDLYYNGTNATTCIYDRAIFTSYAQEKAHNNRYFQLAGGAQSTAYSATTNLPSTAVDYTPTTRTLTATTALGFSSFSEDGGAHSGSVFAPAVCRCTAQFVDYGRIRVDASTSFSPTAPILGFALTSEVADGPSFLNSIDHYEDQSGNMLNGLFLNSPVFDIVLKDPLPLQSGYVALKVVVGVPDYPVTTSAEVLTNHALSVSAQIFINATGEDTTTFSFIVRESNEIKKRPGHQLWQHPGAARFWSHDPKTGAIDKTDDEGATYQNMANAWTGISGAKPLFTDSFGDGGALSIAKVGSNVQFRSSVDGINWGAISTVCPYTTGAWCAREHKASETAIVTVAGPTKDYRSTNAGEGASATWQEIT